MSALPERRKTLFTEKRKQRTYYAGILAWTFLCYFDANDWQTKKGLFFTTRDLIFWLVPCLILLYQAAYNTRLLWLLIFTATFLYTFIGIYIIFTGSRDGGWLAFTSAILTITAWLLRPEPFKRTEP